ncbi:MAG: hypothetical protein PHD95_02440 [Candidatus ainarchaeum sp.]|nr:hypothetical protein [Candidatus ainarchaeum sp.]
MFKPNTEQKKLILQIGKAAREVWKWENLWVFIDSESQSGALQQFGGEAHIDPEKARLHPLGKKLLYLKDLFKKRAKLASSNFKSLAENAKMAGVPLSLIDKIFETVGNKSAMPTMEKLFSFVRKVVEQPELSRAAAIKGLRDAIRNADPRFVSQREINLLADSLAALESKPVKYTPAPHVAEYLELRKRVQQKRRRV